MTINIKNTRYQASGNKVLKLREVHKLTRTSLLAPEVEITVSRNSGNTTPFQPHETEVQLALRIARLLNEDAEVKKQSIDDSVDSDPAEVAYWNFDARKKGYAEWKGAPQSERDAFKAEIRIAVEQALRNK